MALGGKLLGKHLARFLGHSQGLIDAGADGRAAQVIAGQAQTWEARAKLCDRRQAIGMAEIVLRQGARPNCDIGKDGLPLHGEESGDLAVDERYQFLRLQLCRGGVGCSADEAGQQGVTFWSAAGEER